MNKNKESNNIEKPLDLTHLKGNESVKIFDKNMHLINIQGADISRKDVEEKVNIRSSLMLFKLLRLKEDIEFLGGILEYEVINNITHLSYNEIDEIFEFVDYIDTPNILHKLTIYDYLLMEEYLIIERVHLFKQHNITEEYFNENRHKYER